MFLHSMKYKITAKEILDAIKDNKISEAEFEVSGNRVSIHTGVPDDCDIEIEFAALDNLWVFDSDRKAIQNGTEGILKSHDDHIYMTVNCDSVPLSIEILVVDAYMFFPGG